MKKWFTRLGLAMAIFAGTTTAMAQQTLVVDGSRSYAWELTQGADYILPGTDGSWYCQPGFFTHKEGDKWTFRANDMAMYGYAIVLDEEKKYIEVTLINATGGEGVDAAPTATWGTNKAMWLNGNEKIGFPSFAVNNINWGGGKDVAVPEIADGVYQLSLVCGEQIDPSSINFKFFMGKNWGGDMGTSVLWLEDNDYIRMGQQDGGDGDNGNLYGKGGDLGDLDTLVVTVDFNKMHGELGTIHVEKHGYTPAAFPQLNGSDLTKYGNTYYANLALAPGQELQFANLEAIELKWEDLYVNECFAKKGENGKLTWGAVEGNYCIEVVPNLSYIRIYPGAYGQPATYQDGKALWIIGEGFGRPSVNGYAAGWNTGIEKDFAVAQVQPNVYAMNLMCDTEMWDSWCNWKFFGQPDWGIEFKPGTDYSITSDNQWLNVGESDGNIGFKEGAAFTKGEPIYIVVDFSAGLNAGVMTVSTNPILESISNVLMGKADGNIYDLAGKRVNSASQHGIYIMNGKKTIR